MGTILMIPAAMVPIMRGLTHDDVVDDLRIFDGKWIKKVKDSIVVTKTTFNPATGKYDDPKTRVQSVPMMMVTDELISIGGRIGKFSGSVKFEDDDLVDDLIFNNVKNKIDSYVNRTEKNGNHRQWADNSLTCDSEGNCMLKDELFKCVKMGAMKGKASAGIRCVKWE